MRKILLLGLLGISTFAFSQQLISFESSEGFTLGNIDTQVGWTTTSTGTSNVTNQVIVNTENTLGTNSLKITKETAYGGQTNPVVGAFKQLGSTIPHNNFTVSFDMKITDQSSSASDYEFQTIGPNTTGGNSYHVRLKFVSTGTIVAAQTTGATSTFATTTGTWTPNTWFRVKVVGTSTGLTYYINGTQIYSGNFFTTFDFNQFAFVHDNFVGSAFIDRVALNNEAVLSTNEVQNNLSSTVKLYPNPTTDYIILDTKERINSISIYDFSGKKMNVSNDNNRVDVRSLPSGSYLINIETKEGKTSEKFIKK